MVVGMAVIVSVAVIMFMLMLLGLRVLMRCVTVFVLVMGMAVAMFPFMVLIPMVVPVRMIALMFVLIFFSHFLVLTFLLLPNVYCLLPCLTSSTFRSSRPTALR